MTERLTYLCDECGCRLDDLGRWSFCAPPEPWRRLSFRHYSGKTNRDGEKEFDTVEKDFCSGACVINYLGRRIAETAAANAEEGTA